MDHPKILIMVLAADVPPHDALAKAIKETWGRWRSDHLTTLYYWGRRRLDPPIPSWDIRMVGDDILIGVEEGLGAVLVKTLMAYKFVLENFDFDFIFRCCSGSFVVPHLLLDFAAKKPRKEVWCGVTDTTCFPHPFVSGSGMLLSRDLVQMISENAKEVLAAPYEHDKDDVCVAWLLTRRGVKPDMDARRADDTDNLVPGCYHYHFGKHPEHMRTIHRKLAGGKAS